MNNRRISSRKASIAKTTLPFIVWFAVLGLCISLYLKTSRCPRITAIASGATAQIYGPETGMITSMPLKKFQAVKKGDTIAVVDTSALPQNKHENAIIQIEKQLMQAEISLSKAKLKATATSLKQRDNEFQQSEMDRKYTLIFDIEQTRIDSLKTKAELEPLKVLLKSLEFEKDSLKELLDEQAIEPFEYEKAGFEYEQVSSQIVNLEKLLKSYNDHQQQLTKRLENLNLSSTTNDEIETLLEPLREELELKSRQMQELFLPSTTITIKAPFDGIIKNIYFTTGQILPCNDAIITMTSAKPDGITAWLNLDQAQYVNVGTVVEITKTTGEQFISTVTSIGPAFEELPQYLWHDPSTPQCGRPIDILITEQMNLKIDERIGISYESVEGVAK